METDQLNGKNNQPQTADEGRPQNPAIFKLNFDCLDKIFDYLSLKDVHSFGETCKPFHQAAGEYFQINFVVEGYVDQKDITYSTHCCRMSGFNEFAQNLLFSTHISTRSLKKFVRYAANNCCPKLKRIRFYQVDLTGEEIQYLHKMLTHVESMVIEGCTVKRGFYEAMPTLCTNLKRIYVREFDCTTALKRMKNKWLLIAYPQLVHLHWTQSENGNLINELVTFFEINPQVRSFTTDIKCLWANRHVFMASQIKLVDLTVENSKQNETPENIQNICTLLKELHGKGVYMRLHFNLNWFNQQTLNQVASLNALKSLCMNFHDSESNDPVILPPAINLIDLKASFFVRFINIDSMESQFLNLERIYLGMVNITTVELFICHSAKLTKMKISSFDREDNYDENDNCFLDLVKLNKEREKLNGARKLTIYIFERIYLATKWTIKQTDFNLIEMQRDTSHEWGHRFIQWY